MTPGALRPLPGLELLGQALGPRLLDPSGPGPRLTPALLALALLSADRRLLGGTVIGDDPLLQDSEQGPELGLQRPPRALAPVTAPPAAVRQLEAQTTVGAPALNVGRRYLKRAVPPAVLGAPAPDVLGREQQRLGQLVDLHSVRVAPYDDRHAGAQFVPLLIDRLDIPAAPLCLGEDRLDDPERAV